MSPAAAAGSPAPRIVVKGHGPGKAVADTVRVIVVARGDVSKVSFYLDRRRLWTDSASPWRLGRGGRLNTLKLTNGKHRLRARVSYRSGTSISVARTLLVRNEVGRRSAEPAPLSELLGIPAAAPAPLVDAARKNGIERPPTDGSTPAVSFRAPLQGATVSGSLGDSACEVSASDPAGISHVDFFVDGSALNVERYAPWTCEWNTASVANGAHTLSAKAYDALGNAGTASVAVTVTNGTSTTPPPPAPVGTATFADSFESGGFAAGDWYYGASEPTYAPARVVTAASAGIPSRDGSYVARFESTSATRNQSKLFKHFGSATVVGGDYRFWYYLPASLSYPTDGQTTNIFQWKERTGPGGAVSNAHWWIEVKPYAQVKSLAGTWHGTRPTRDTAPVAYVRNRAQRGGANFIALPLGRWFEMRGDMFVSDRIDFYIDGVKFHTGYNSEYRVGKVYGYEWIWGVGHYGPPLGPYYGDAATYHRR